MWINDGNVKLDVNLENETVWLSANQMSLIFNRDEKVIRKHINNVFSEGELDKENNLLHIIIWMLLLVWDTVLNL